MNPKFYLPAGKIQSDEDLEKQLGIVEDESWPVALIALACALFVFLCFADRCHFFAYDYRMKEDKHKLAYLIIEPVAEDLERIGLKLGSAIKEKESILNLLK